MKPLKKPLLPQVIGVMLKIGKVQLLVEHSLLLWFQAIMVLVYIKILQLFNTKYGAFKRHTTGSQHDISCKNAQ